MRLPCSVGKIVVLVNRRDAEFSKNVDRSWSEAPIYEKLHGVVILFGGNVSGSEQVGKRVVKPNRGFDGG